jgi:hypothetical protein
VVGEPLPPLGEPIGNSYQVSGDRDRGVVPPAFRDAMPKPILMLLGEPQFEGKKRLEGQGQFFKISP